tara:strand:+ start:2248 stop:2463 length:216 start_codon:yes stop_codon:yes gene_type:complete
MGTTQRSKGILSNMSDDKLKRLFGFNSLDEIINITPSKGGTTTIDQLLKSDAQNLKTLKAKLKARKKSKTT